MKVSTERLYNKNQTARGMKFLINKYFRDLDNYYVVKNGLKFPLLDLSLEDFFNYVRKLPYKRDEKPIEKIARPKYIIENALSGNGIDCKKKAILISSFLKARKMPYRLIASSNQQDKRIHHVFPQVKIKNTWLNCDATYNHDRLFRPKNVTKYEVL